MKFMFFNKISLIYNFISAVCFAAITLVNMVSVTPALLYITSASRYHPRYQSRSSMYIRGLIPRNFAELAEAVPIEDTCSMYSYYTFQIANKMV